MEHENVELLRTEYVYPSGRLYPRKQVEDLFEGNSLFAKKVRDGFLIPGELNRPKKVGVEMADEYFKRFMTVREENLSHLIKNIRLDDDGILRGTVVPAGPKAFIYDSTNIGKLNMRAIARFESRDGVNQPMPGTLRVISFDLTNDIDGDPTVENLWSPSEKHEESESKTKGLGKSYLLELGSLACAAQALLSEHEILMLCTLKRMSEIPEGPNTTFEVVRSIYSLNRLLAETTLKQVHNLKEIVKIENENARARFFRMRSALMLVSSLQPIELEREGKGEIFRLYDQARRELISSYEFEASRLQFEYQNIQ